MTTTHTVSKPKRGWRKAFSPANVKAAKAAMRETGGEKKALAILERAHTHVYALEELAKNAAKISFSRSTLVEAAGIAACDKLDDTFNEARKSLPKSHPARAFLRKATAAINDVSAIVYFFSHTGGDNKKWDEETAGRAMLGFVLDAGRWMERAEIAIAPSSFYCGWLDKSYVEGWEGYSPYRHPESRHVASIAEALSSDARMSLWFDAVERLRAEDPERAGRLLKNMKDVVFVVK